MPLHRCTSSPFASVAAVALLSCASMAATAATPTPTSAPKSGLSAAKVLGRGLVDHWAPNSKAVVALAVDPKLSKIGCEGIVEPVQMIVPIDGGDRRPAVPGYPERNGSFVGRHGTTVVLVEGCERFIGAIVTATEANDGTLSNVRIVQAGGPDPLPEMSSAMSLSLDGRSILITGRNSDDDNRAVTSRVDLTTLAVTKMMLVGRSGKRIEAASQGRIVVGDGKRAYVLRGDGKLVRSYVATDFSVSADGSTIALVSSSKLWVVPVGDNLNASVTLPTGVDAWVTLASDNRSVAVAGIGTKGWVAVVRGRRVQTVARGGIYGRPTWNGRGTAVAFNRFPADFGSEEIMVVEDRSVDK